MAFLPEYFYDLAKNSGPGVDDDCEGGIALALEGYGEYGQRRPSRTVGQDSVGDYQGRRHPDYGHLGQLEWRVRMHHRRAGSLQLDGRIGISVDGGPSPRDIASTIVDLSDADGWRIMREGAIPAEEIRQVLAK